MNARIALLLALLMAIAGCSSQFVEKKLAHVEKTANHGPFSPSWESLAQYEIPTWYQDAKFGIFIHWGAYSVPAYGNEWYPREMYNANKNRRGIYQHHQKTYQDMLRKMGGWLSLNGEAIYSTRPWHVFGEGPTRVEDGTMANDAEHRRSDFVANDIRFTATKEALYAIGLEWPENDQVIIKSLAKDNTANSFPVKDVKLLGYRGVVSWEQTDQGLVIQMPEDQPCEYAFTLKIAGIK